MEALGHYPSAREKKKKLTPLFQARTAPPKKARPLFPTAHDGDSGAGGGTCWMPRWPKKTRPDFTVTFRRLGDDIDPSGELKISCREKVVR